MGLLHDISQVSLVQVSELSKWKGIVVYTMNAINKCVYLNCSNMILIWYMNNVNDPLATQLLYANGTH